MSSSSSEYSVDDAVRFEENNESDRALSGCLLRPSPFANVVTADMVAAAAVSILLTVQFPNRRLLPLRRPSRPCITFSCAAVEVADGLVVDDDVAGVGVGVGASVMVLICVCVCVCVLWYGNLHYNNCCCGQRVMFV